MKKLSILLIAAFVIGWGAVSAQCTINNSNTTIGITPTNSDDTLTQGVAYSQTFQIYVPATYLTYTVDSIHIASITGGPSGLTYVYNPQGGNGVGGTIAGGHNGAICINGTTTAPVGNYPLTFTGTIYTNLASVPLSTLAADFTYAFNVKAAPASACDTIFNEAGDTAAAYTVGVTADSGYISGNNIYGDQAKAEGFKAVIGDYVNSAVLYFAISTIAPADSGNVVTIGVWDNTGTSAAGNAGAPGNMIDSAHVTLAQISQAVTATINNQALIGLLVNFPASVALTGDTFYIGVVLPATTGDTVALFTTAAPGVKGDGWELSAGTFGWGTYNNDWGFGGNIGNYIIANICSSPETVYPSASFTSSTGGTACTGAPIVFTDASASTPAASGFGWSFGDGGYSSLQDPTYSYSASGTYVVTEYVTNNLGGAIQAFEPSSGSITVNASPAATTTATFASSPTAHNGGATVTATGGSGTYTYSWVDGGTTDTIANVGVGTYTVTVTDANTCSTTASVSIFVTGVISLNNNATVSVYPNPATDVLNLVFSEKSNSDVSVVDLNGKVISTFTTVGDTKFVCNIHNLASGNYILRLTDKTSNEQQSMLFSKF